MKHFPFFNGVWKVMRMEDAKPWIEALFCETKVTKLLSYLRLKFNVDFIRWGVLSCMHKRSFLKYERWQLSYWVLRRLYMEVRPMKSDFRETSLNKIKRTLTEAVTQGCSLRKGVLRNFWKFTGKHLCQSFFFNKVARLILQLC